MSSDSRKIIYECLSIDAYLDDVHTYEDLVRCEYSLAHFDKRYEARENLENYMRAIKHGLDKNEAYWQQEAAFQKRMADFKADMTKLQTELSVARATGQDVKEISKNINQLQATMNKFARDARVKP